MSEKIKVPRKAVIAVVIGGVALAAAAGIAMKLKASTSSRTSEVSETSAPPVFAGNPDGRPDALVVTKSLSELPKDILKQPMLKEVLTSDFVFYYQESESYLSLKGALKRIAFESDLSLFDELFLYALKSPAELALWKSYNGRLDDYMLILERNTLTDLLTAAAKVSIDDAQLTKYADKAEGGENLAIYKFHYSHSRDLYFTAIKNKLVVFSHPGMPLPTPERMKKWVTAAHPSGAAKASASFSQLFDDSGSNQGKHALYFSANSLSFGYQRFFPGIDAIRFRFDDQGNWRMQAMVKSQLMKTDFDASALWRSIPKGPSLCFALPVSASHLNDLAAKIFKGKENDIKNAVSSIESPVAICWYAESKFYAPLILMKLRSPVNREFLRTAFEQMIGGLEAGILTDEEMKLFREQRQEIAAGKTVENPVQATDFEPSFPVIQSKGKEGMIWSREVSSRFGIYDAEKSKNSAKMRSKKFFNVRMANWKDYLIFSPDDKLVDDAVSVIEKKFPALSDSLTDRKGISLVLSPSKIAELLKQATLDSLPAEQESVFRESVSRRMFPALERLKKFPALTAIMNHSGKDGWEEVEWQTFSSN